MLKRAIERKTEKKSKKFVTHVKLVPASRSNCHFSHLRPISFNEHEIKHYYLFNFFSVILK